MKILKVIDKIDFGVMEKAEALVAKGIKEMKKEITDLTDFLHIDSKKYKQKNVELTANYETVAKWI